MNSFYSVLILISGMNFYLFLQYNWTFLFLIGNPTHLLHYIQADSDIIYSLSRILVIMAADGEAAGNVPMWVKKLIYEAWAYWIFFDWIFVMQHCPPFKMSSTILKTCGNVKSTLHLLLSSLTSVIHYCRWWQCYIMVSLCLMSWHGPLKLTDKWPAHLSHVTETFLALEGGFSVITIKVTWRCWSVVFTQYSWITHFKHHKFPCYVS